MAKHRRFTPLAQLEQLGGRLTMALDIQKKPPFGSPPLGSIELVSKATDG